MTCRTVRRRILDPILPPIKTNQPKPTGNKSILANPKWCCRMVTVRCVASPGWRKESGAYPRRYGGKSRGYTPSTFRANLNAARGARLGQRSVSLYTDDPPPIAQNFSDRHRRKTRRAGFNLVRGRFVFDKEMGGGRRQFRIEIIRWTK